MATSYQGFDVLEVEPNWRDGADASLRRSWFRLDPGNGKVRVDDRTGLSFAAGSFSWFLDGGAAISEFLTFVQARRGAAVPFWAPTWRADLPLKNAIAAIDTTATIEAIGYTKFQFPQASRRFIAFMLPSGSKIYREILGSTDPGDGVSETITLDSAPGVEIPASTVVSFLLFCRLESDEAKIVWHTSGVAESVLEFREIPGEVP